MAGEIDLVEAAFAGLAGEYKRRKKAAEKLVVEWKWSKSSLFDLRPLWNESHGWATGRPLRQAPAKPVNHFESGFDKSGRLVVERQYTPYGPYETFCDWSTDPVEVAHYDYGREKEPINLMHAYLEDGRTISTFRSAVYGFDREVYHWEDGVVTSIDVFHADRKNGKLARPKKWHTVRARYDAAGVLQRVDLVPPSKSSKPEVVYERRGTKIFRRG